MAYVVLQPLTDHENLLIQPKHCALSYQVMVEGQHMPISMLREKTKEFLLNPLNKEDLPEKRLDNIEYVGEVEITKGIISIKNDRQTSYGMFIKVKNELIAAGNEVKDEFSLQKFGKHYKDLSDHLQKAVRSSVPAVISESEPMQTSK